MINLCRNSTLSAIYTTTVRLKANFSSEATSSLLEIIEPNSSSVDVEYADVNWDELGFAAMPTDYMYIMKCSKGDKFSHGELNRYGNIELSPSSGVLNYGQGLFEGLKAYRKANGGIQLFRPEENARRMIMGADRMCMPSPSIEKFVNAVKETVLANKRWVPPPGKGSLYIRPLLIGSGSVLGLAPASNYTFLIYASPVANYFKEGSTPLNLVIDDEFHRSTPGGTGDVKAIVNYAPVLKPQSLAKGGGFSDVLYLDSTTKKNLEEVSSCNIFLVKGSCISTPATQGTILAGITRKSIINIASDFGYQIWKNRNAGLFKGWVRSVPRLISDIQIQMQEHQKGTNQKCSAPEGILSCKIRRDKWEPPKLGSIKYNTDAAFSYSLNSAKADLGWVARNSNGKPVFAACSPSVCLATPLAAEAAALLDALVHAQQQNLMAVFFESDCLSLVGFCNGTAGEHRYLGAMAGDIKLILRNNSQFIVQFCNRQINSLAHKLSKFASSLKERTVWEQPFPSVIFDQFCMDRF